MQDDGDAELGTIEVDVGETDICTAGDSMRRESEIPVHYEWTSDLNGR